MKLKQYQVDAFARRAFEGNPAAVCLLESWLPDAQLQAIAEENNLSETAFLVPFPVPLDSAQGSGFALRWFTPVSEVDLCGHATLAAAHVLFSELGYAAPALVFATRSGELTVTKKEEGAMLEMDFPASSPVLCDTPEVWELLSLALGQRPSEVWAAEDYLAVFDKPVMVQSIRPDHALLSQLDRRGVIVSAPVAAGDAAYPGVDFVSRFFAPRLGVAEDPVTGSAHCLLAPYWAAKLGKTALNAQQISNRGGHLHCELKADRVLLSGTAVTFMVAEIRL